MIRMESWLAKESGNNSKASQPKWNAVYAKMNSSILLFLEVLPVEEINIHLNFIQQKIKWQI